MLTAEGVPHCPYCDQKMTQITKNLTGETYGCEKCVNDWTVFLHHAPPLAPTKSTLTPVAEIKTPKP